MKKILILALTAVATFGATLAFNADETYTSLDDLEGLTLELALDETFNAMYEQVEVGTPAILNINFTSNGVIYNGMRLSTTNGEKYYLDYGVDDEWSTAYYFDNLEWYSEELSVIAIASNQTITSNNSSLFLQMFNTYSTDITPEPVDTPTMWQAILSGIGGFFSGMFSVLSGLFSGVVAVFYTNNTTTILLQAIIFAAAAGLVAAAVYVIVRLIKSAIARLRGGVGGAGGYYINDKRVSRFTYKRNILRNEGREGLRSWKSKNKRYRRLLRARRK